MELDGKVSKCDKVGSEVPKLPKCGFESVGNWIDNIPLALKGLEDPHLGSNKLEPQQYGMGVQIQV